MSNKRQFLSEISREGEQICVVRYIYETNPPECHVCRLRRFCEEQRSDEEIADITAQFEREAFRRDFNEMMEEEEYYN